MKVLTLLIIITVALLPAAGLTQTCVIEITDVSGSVNDGGATKLYAGQTHVLTLHADVTCAPGGEYYGMTHTFAMWSPDGAGWNYLEGHGTTDWFSFDWDAYFIHHYHWDFGTEEWVKESGGSTETDPAPGNPGDSVACMFVGITFGSGHGMPAGYYSEWATLEFQTEVVDVGRHICIDSIEGITGGEWGWWNARTGHIYPQWYSGECFEIIVAAQSPPEFTNCPLELHTSYPSEIDYTFNAEDINGDPFTYEVVSGPGTIDPNSGYWSYQTTPGDVGQTYTLVVCASDASHGCPTGSECTVDVYISNGPPVFTNCPAGLTGAYPGQIEYDFDADDPNSDPITYEIVTGPGTIDPNSGFWYYQPTHEDFGNTYGLEVCATDPTNTCPTGLECTVEISVDSLDWYNMQDGADAGVWQLLTGDLDHDNETDLVWTGDGSSGNDGVLVAYGDGQGSFEQPVMYGTAGGAGAIALDYIDTDTLMDILVRDLSNGVCVLLNNGGRSFSVNTCYTLPFPQEVSAIVTGYFNDDRFLDVITDESSYVGYGTGDLYPGLFAPTFWGADVGDFNGDGIDDLVTAEFQELAIYTNDGFGDFFKTGSVPTTSNSYSVSSASGLADFDHDHNIDFAGVSYRAGSSDSSEITIVFGDGSGGVDRVHRIDVDGISHNLVVTDVDRNHELDIVLSNTVKVRMEIYLGDGTGAFSDPLMIPWGVDYVVVPLATGDFDRDGNPDFATGKFVTGGLPLRLAYSQMPAAPVIADEMRTTGYSYTSVEVTNPTGYLISEQVRTVAGSNYMRFDANTDGDLDERAFDYNVQYGEYCIDISLRPDAPPGAGVSMGIGVNGTQEAMIFNDYSLLPKFSKGDSRDVITFCYTLEEISSISPGNGVPTGNQQPTFDWSGLVLKGRLPDTYNFQLSRYHDLSEPLYDVSDLASPQYTPPAPLGVDSVFYWRFRTHDGGSWSDFSNTFAAYIVEFSTCCITPSVGDLDQGGGDLGFNYDGADLSAMINGLFIDPTNGWNGICLDEADVDFTSERPVTDPMTIDGADLSLLIDALFIAPSHYLKNCDGTDNY